MRWNDPVDVPYVRNTFLSLDPPRHPMASLRSLSLSPKGTSDAFAQQLHALMYKPTPVERPSCGWGQNRRCDELHRNEEEVEPDALELTLPWAGTTPRGRSLRRGGECKKAADDGRELSLPWCGGIEISGGESNETTSTETPPAELGAHLHEEDCEEEDEELLLARIPRDEKGALLSLGSIAHEEGNCKPCVFAYHENKRCENGWRCPFCHYIHPPKKRVRLCKKKRMELKRLQEKQGAEMDLGEEED